MEPRLFGRGYNSYVHGHYTDAQLQWSRGFSAADTTEVAAEIEPVAKLQWSRGFSAADTVFGVCADTHYSRLQWSRGFSAADTASRFLGCRL